MILLCLEKKKFALLKQTSNWHYSGEISNRGGLQLVFGMNRSPNFKESVNGAFLKIFAFLQL